MKRVLFFTLLFFLNSSTLNAESKIIVYKKEKRSYFIVNDKKFIIPIDTLKEKVKSYTESPEKFKNIKDRIFINGKT